MADSYWNKFEDNTKNNHYAVMVQEAVAPTMTFAPESLTVAFGEEFTAPVLTIKKGNKVLENLTVAYSSGDETVAMVNANTGELTLVGEGETTITASFAGDENLGLLENTASYVLTVNKGEAGLAYSVAAFEGRMGVTSADAFPTLTNPHNLAVTYNSSDPTVATVGDDGVVNMLSNGTTVITASTSGNDFYEAGSAQYTLTVSAPSSDLSVSASEATIVYGGDVATLPTFNNPNGLPLTYASNNPEVATIDETGTVTLVGAGTTTISATFAGNEVLPNEEVLSYTLTVTRRPAALAFEGNTNMEFLFDEQPEASAYPVLQNPNNVVVTFASSNEQVATVDQTGDVTVLAVGETTITASAPQTTTDEAASASYTIKVKDAYILVDEAGVEWKARDLTTGKIFLTPVDLTQETYTLYNTVTLQGTNTQYTVNGLAKHVFDDVTTVKTIDMSRVTKLDTVGCFFMNQQSIEHLYLPQTVAFKNFGGVYNNPSPNFKGMTALQEIVLPEGINTLWGDLFNGCSSLQSVTLPASLTALGSNSTSVNPPFYNCWALKQVNFAEGIKLTTNLYRCFAYSGVETITLPPSVTKLNSNAKLFEGCQYLKAINLSQTNITEIYSSAFSTTTQPIPVDSITFPSTLTTIKSGAFYGLTSLKVLELNEGFTTVAGAMFNGLDSIQTVKFPSTLTSWSNPFSTAAVRASIKHIIFPDSVPGVSLSSLATFSSLEDIVLPKCIGINGYQLLKECPSLKSVYLKCDPSDITIASTNTGTNAPFYGLQNVTFYVADEATYEAFVNYQSGVETCPQPWALVDNQNGNHYDFPHKPHLAFEADEMTIYVGQQDVTGAVLTNGDGLAITYTSSDTDVVEVDGESGVLTPKAVGTATITAIYEGDGMGYLLADSASYTVTVEQVAANLAYTPTSVTCLYGAEVEWPVLSNEHNFPVTFSSSDESVATIDAEGVVTMVGIGTTTITATCSVVTPEETAQFVLTIEKSVAEISYSAEEANFLMGYTSVSDLPTVTVTDWVEEVVYTSSDTNVATIDANGVVTVLAEGTTIITATVPGTIGYDEASASYTLHVSATADIAFYWESLDEMNDGEPTEYDENQLEFYWLPFYNPFNLDITFQSSNTNVISIIQDECTNTQFSVKANGAGEADVLAVFAGTGSVPAKTVSMHFNILKKTYTASWGTDTFDAYLDLVEDGVDGNVYPTLTTSLQSYSTSKIRYYSSNTDVAEINILTGVITLKADGVTTITARLTGNANVNVTEASYTLNVTYQTPTVHVSSAGWATYYGEMGLDFSNREDSLEAYVVSSYDGSSLKIVKVKEDCIGGTPLLLKAPEGDYVLKVKRNYTQYGNLLLGTSGIIWLEGNEGDYTNMILGNGSNGVGFYKSMSGEFGPHKAYLQVLTSVAEAASNFFSLFVVDEETAIREAQLREALNDGHWYTLQGVRIDRPTQPGIYIHNGRKVVLKWSDVELLMK